MPTNIDELQIEINTKASNASRGVTGLTKRLEKLSAAINGINTTQFNSVASGIGAIGTNSNNTSIGLTKTAKSALSSSVSNRINATNSLMGNQDSITRDALLKIVDKLNARTNVNVTLEGDAGEIFRVVQNQEDDYYKRTQTPGFHH